jgi:hypothetical protein
MGEPSISATEIVNRALVRIGSSRIQDINNLSDPKTAAAATLYYEARDAMLRSARWNFARKFVSLAALAATPPGLALLPDPDYSGQIIYTGAYQLPSDYLRLSSVSPYKSHWRIVGRALFTDAPSPATSGVLVGLQPPNADGADNVPTSSNTIGSQTPNGIEYIYKVTDATKFDPMFATALALRVAYGMAFGTTALRDLRTELRQEAKEMFDEARAVAGMEQWPEQLWDTVMIDVRHEYGSGFGWTEF